MTTRRRVIRLLFSAKPFPVGRTAERTEEPVCAISEKIGTIGSGPSPTLFLRRNEVTDFIDRDLR